MGGIVMSPEIISVIGVAIAIILIIFLVMKDVPILLTGLIGVVIMALTGSLGMKEAMLDTYMVGYANYFGRYFLMFLTGALLGKIYESTGAAEAIAVLFGRLFGPKWAPLATVLAAGLMCYGGVSLFVVAFAVYPIAAKLYKEADLPRRFIPGAMCLGTGSFAINSPGSPQIHNIVPGDILGDGPMGGAVFGFICSAFILVVGMIWYYAVMNKCIKNGEGWTDPPGHEVKEDRKPEDLPNGWIAFIPLIVVVIALNVVGLRVEIATLLGCVLAIIMFAKYKEDKVFSIFSSGTESAIAAITASCAMVGIGTVLTAVPAYQFLIDKLLNMPGPPLLSVWLTTTLISGITASGSSAVSIVTPILGEQFVAAGVPASAVHRVITLSSCGMDTSPHAGYVCTTLKVCGGVVHKEGYGMIFRMTVITTNLAALLAVLLFTVFPNMP